MVDERRTAFPNMWVQSVEVEKPPFDEPGVVQEFVGKGATRQFDALKKAGELKEVDMTNVLEGFEESVGPLRDTYKLKYNLLVRVPVGNPFTKRGIRMRVRTWVRVKNPFEPDLINVARVQQAGEEWDSMQGDFYEVTAEVTK